MGAKRHEVPKSNLKKLKVLTKELFPESIGETVQGVTKRVEYKMDKGICYAWNLKNLSGKISCADWFNSKGTKFPLHAHESFEWLVIYEGKCVLTVDGVKHILTPKDSYYILPNVIHSATFPVDTWYIALTIPDNPDWPT